MLRHIGFPLPAARIARVHVTLHGITRAYDMAYRLLPAADVRTVAHISCGQRSSRQKRGLGLGKDEGLSPTSPADDL